MTRQPHRDAPRGQVLVIVAVGSIVLLGFAALVIDVGMAYATQRYERSVADAASLAGAQQLQLAGTRQVGPSEYQDARTVAMHNVVNQLTPGATTPTCTSGGSAPYATNVVRCAIPNSPYRVSISAPSPVCTNAGCDITRSVLVSVTRVNLPTFLASLFGQSGWDVSQASVAGLQNIGKYAVITLRPPKPLKTGNDANVDDINVSGSNTLLQVSTGDIGTNTNLVVSGAVTLSPGFVVYHYDTYLAWTPPPGEKVLPIPIPDPMYPYPTRTGAPTYTLTNLSDAQDAVNCATEKAQVPSQYTVGGTPITNMAAAKVTCYKPGIYTQQLSNAHNDEAVLLEPGVYFFDAGVKLGVGAFVGGYEASPKPGVALVFKECNSTCIFDGNNSPLIALNGGTKFNNAGGQEATAGVGFDGKPVRTNAGFKPTEIAITMLVERDPNCYVATVEPGACQDNANNTLNIAGNGALYLAGVQYAPSDNVKFNGGSAGTGYVGQIIAWTITYTGGSVIKQAFVPNLGNGVLRLDQSCSGTDAGNASCYP